MRDMRYRLFALLAILGLAFAAPIREIQVVGADPVLATLARIALPVSVGDEAKGLSSEALIRAVKATGYFQEVEVDLKDGVLTVRVKPNPPITSLEVQATAFPRTSSRTFWPTSWPSPPAAFTTPRRSPKPNRSSPSSSDSKAFPSNPRSGVKRAL